MKPGIKPLFLKQLNKKVNLSPAKSFCLKIETGKKIKGICVQLESSQNGNSHKIVVKNVIKTIEDSTIFKKSISDILLKDPSAKIDIHIIDSYIITSSIIGTLLKMVQKDNAKITVYVYSADLYELLDKLNLIILLNVKKEF